MSFPFFIDQNDIDACRKALLYMYTFCRNIFFLQKAQNSFPCLIIANFGNQLYLFSQFRKDDCFIQRIAPKRHFDGFHRDRPCRKNRCIYRGCQNINDRRTDHSNVKCHYSSPSLYTSDILLLSSILYFPCNCDLYSFCFPRP